MQSEVIKLPTIEALSSVNPLYNPHQLPNRVVGHNTNRHNINRHIILGTIPDLDTASDEKVDRGLGSRLEASANFFHIALEGCRSNYNWQIDGFYQKIFRAADNF